jgi:hypothetical protein
MAAIAARKGVARLADLIGRAQRDRAIPASDA